MTEVRQEAFVHASTDQRCVRLDNIYGGWAGRNATGVEKQFPTYEAACRYAGLTPRVREPSDV